MKVIPIVSAQDMYKAVTENFPQQDIVIKAAAVADYRPAVVSSEKVKKKEEQFLLPMERTGIFCSTWASIKEKTSICAVFPWKRNI